MSRTEMDKGRVTVPLNLGWLGHSTSNQVPHISICVCSYKRPHLLKRLLLKLNQQETANLFTYSVVVSDNDEEKSGAAVVAKVSSICKVPIRYCVEPRRNIALARNKAIENAEGAYVALIDDDEFPEPTWLLTLYQNLCEYRVDGVLGVVRRHFEEIPPEWFRKSGIYSRKVNPTGTLVRWKESRTGNALLKRGMFVFDPAPFRPEFRAGEDQDFFRRKIEAGYKFIWSADAIVSETIPPARWKRSYILRKAVLQGATFALQPTCTWTNIVKSLIAVPLYLLALPFTLLIGQQYFMQLLIKICDHSGKVLMRAGINPIREEYVSD
jgi:Glycosyltransferases, probably involved in cell wall biogenesis